MRSIKKILSNEWYWFGISICFLLIGMFTEVSRIDTGIFFFGSFSIGLLVSRVNKK